MGRWVHSTSGVWLSRRCFTPRWDTWSRSHGCYRLLRSWGSEVNLQMKQRIQINTFSAQETFWVPWTCGPWRKELPTVAERKPLAAESQTTLMPSMWEGSIAVCPNLWWPCRRGAKWARTNLISHSSSRENLFALGNQSSLQHQFSGSCGDYHWARRILQGEMDFHRKKRKTWPLYYPDSSVSLGCSVFLRCFTKIYKEQLSYVQTNKKWLGTQIVCRQAA